MIYAQMLFRYYIGAIIIVNLALRTRIMCDDLYQMCILESFALITPHWKVL